MIRGLLAGTALSLALTVNPSLAQQAPAAAAPAALPAVQASRPNVIYILLDDTGFADLGSFGSEISTPNLDRLATEGLRYNSFHTRGICSPSRAALLTGRNSHSVGMGNLTHVITDTPGRQGEISHSAGTVAEYLRAGGYNTIAIGKWHLSPEGKASAPDRSQWPLQRGFNQYYGLIGGMTDQFHPELILGNSAVAPPETPGYTLNADLVDHSVQYIQEAKARNPSQPFFLYFATGATHWPHQAPANYLQKYAGHYDKGWDKVRAERFARQKKLGLIPASTKLPPRSEGVKAWDQLTGEERKVAAQFQTAYAGFLEQTDAEVGRLLSFLDRAKLMDNTIIVLMSDNGADDDGRDIGTTNLTYNHTNLAHKRQTTSELAAHIGDIGTEKSNGMYPTGWAMAGNTPFQGFKHGVREGGIRDPLIVHWPNGIKDRGKVRSQFVDIIDITPTVLDLAGVKAPDTYNDVPQQPLEGASIAATFGDAKAPAPRSTQYFELQGQRAIWHDGWKAVARHAQGQPFEADQWTLYDQRKDFSASTDLSKQQPARLAELKVLWTREAEKYKVLPVQDTTVMSPQFYEAMKSTLHPYSYYTPAVLPMGTALNITNQSFRISAIVDRTDESTQGVLIASGDRFSGYVLYILDNRLVFDFNDFGKHQVITSDIPVPVGRAIKLEFDFTKSRDFQGLGKLSFNGRPAGQGELTMTPSLVQTWASTDVGLDAGSKVSDAYAGNKEFAYPKEQFIELNVSPK